MEYSQSTTISSPVAEETSHDSKELLLSLPKEKGWLGPGLSLYQGFWCPTMVIQHVISFQKHFQADNSDIILASKPKSGTTWLKALVFTIANRTRFTLSNTPLLTSNPHELVPFLEFSLYSKTQLPILTIIPSPRLFSTHIPYASLPESIKHSNCRVVYLCRNPFDTFISSWYFATRDRPEAQHWSMEELLERYCRGAEGFGPFWDHVLGYWKESLEKPHKVLFLKYEDLKEDTMFHLKRLAEFIGFPFSLEEEREGVIEEISKLCSLSSLKDLEVNMTGKFLPNFANKLYFRKGEVGDWENHLSPSMVERLDKVMQEKFSGSGLTFKVSG